MIKEIKTNKTKGIKNFSHESRKEKEIGPKIKEILKKYNMKGTLGVDNYSTLNLNLKSGSIDFGTDRINE